MERLQNILAQRGIASRRGAAALIESGRVSVNDDVMLEPGFRADITRDVIRVDGIPLPVATEKHRTILIYKPRGIICSADDAQGETICNLVNDLPERLLPVGRLDKDSEGLLLMSNDGDFINHMTHPRYGHEKCYHVKVAGHLTPEKLRILTGPMELDGYQIRPVDVTVLKRGRDHVHLLEMVLREGRNRQIRKMCSTAGLTVLELRRISIGRLTDDTLHPGEWRDLSPTEIQSLTQDTRQHV